MEFPDRFWLNTSCVSTREIAARLGMAVPLSDEQLQALEDVKAAIVSHPEQYNQMSYGGVVTHVSRGIGECDTACCIAGHLALRHPSIGDFTQQSLSRVSGFYAVQDETRFMRVGTTARNLANSMLPNGAYLDDLFTSTPESWPDGLGFAWGRARSDKARAWVAAARINYFVVHGR